jgi:hypothetical protein
VGIGKHSVARAAFVDIVVLIKQVNHRPTRVRELCSTSINYSGYVDAGATGLGGVFFPLNSDVEFTVFRLQLPVDIHTRFHSGLVTMGDLELSVAFLLTVMLEASVALLKHRTIVGWSDNPSTLGWVWRMATKQSNIAGRLIRGLGFRQRMNETCPLATHHIPGDQNKKTYYLSWSYTPSLRLHDDSNVFASFTSLFTLAQNLLWKHVLPPSGITSLIFSTL